jgi:hypothetical protein
LDPISSLAIKYAVEARESIEAAHVTLWEAAVEDETTGWTNAIIATRGRMMKAS